MNDYIVGNKYWYHEMGIIAEVELLEIEQTEAESFRDEGTSFTLRGTGNTKQVNPEENPFKKGLVFTVWRTNDQNGAMYSGWHLMDD